MPLFSINVMKANIYKTSTLEILVFILPFQPEILTLPVSFHIDEHSKGLSAETSPFPSKSPHYS